MTIAIIGNQPFTFARFRALLIRDLVAQGHRVYALGPGWDADPVSRKTIEAVGATPIDIHMGRAAGRLTSELHSVRSIRSALRRIQPDAVLAYFVKPVVYGAVASLGLRIARRVAMIEGLGYMGAAATGGLRARALNALYRFVGARYDTLVVLNEEDERYFTETIALDPQTVLRLPGIGIDVEEFDSGPVPTDSFMFLFVARMLRQKGVFEFIDAAARVRSAHPAARFVMLGDVDDSPDSVGEEELRHRAEAAGVEWFGHVANVHDYFAEASVFVLPSYYREGYPRSIMEAMAAGCAVITTDNPGCREAVTAGVNGFVVPTRDVNALAETMNTLAADPAIAEEMGREGRRMALERYDYRTINPVIIERLTGRPGLPRLA